MELRDELTRFIQGQGHRIEVTDPSDEAQAGELLFRTRGCVFSVAGREGNPPYFEIATAYEIPPWSRERAQNATVLQDAAGNGAGVRFALARSGKSFTVTCGCAAELADFELAFWANVACVRQAGVAALERILDRSESHAAADKFIKSLTKGK
ncbi:MAG: hypothetical protein ACREMP_02020 [Candidatus Tyrphobacter sp.]